MNPTENDNSENMRTITRQWVKIDSEIATLQREISIRKNDKKNLTKTLMEMMKNEGIDCLNTQEDELLYNTKNISKPISQRKLLQLLTEYYKGDMATVLELNTFLLENREKTVKEEIVKKKHKLPKVPEAPLQQS